MNTCLLVFFIGAFLVPNVLSEQCACATGNVHIRDGAGVSHTILSTLLIHHCLPFKGHHQKDTRGANWANVDYRGKDGWIHENYIHISTMTSCSGQAATDAPSHQSSNPNLPGCPHIITRAEWGARPPTHTLPKLAHTPKYMFIHHGASGPCFTKDACIQKVKAYQNYHMDSHGWPDIGYSFVVGEDGNVYEARGWDKVGAHTRGYNDVGLAICVIGNFQDHVPNDKALNAVKQLIHCAETNHQLTTDYKLRGHRDMGSTACPGQKLYDLIQHWPHY